MTTPREDDLDRTLDRTLEALRGELLDPARERAAVEQVWRRLSAALAAQETGAGSPPRRIESCRGFQAVLPDYLAGRLLRGQHLLVEDHVGECVPCRRALKELQSGARPAAAPAEAARRGWASTLGWRVAAAAAVFLTLIGFSWQTDVFSIESGGMIRIESGDGDLFHVTDDGAVPLRIGDVLQLDRDDEIRTGKDSSAILTLADSSRVEMRERSEVGIRQRRHLFPGRKADGLLDLSRGSIIVEASDQGSGHLFVDTSECNVAVTGTVFSVSHGTKGSRVSVVEGQVRVDGRGGPSVLHPGDQTTTRETLDRIPVEEDIAWSRNSAEYVDLLRELHALGRELDEAFRPELRYSTDLLDLAPAGSVVYFAMPNVSDELAQAYAILQDRVATSVVLRRWWEREISASDADEISSILDRVRSFGEHLGPEVVMTLQVDDGGRVIGPLFLARLTSPGTFKEVLEGQIAELEQRYDEDLPIALLEGPTPTVAPPAAELYFHVQDDLLAMTPNLENLWALERAVQNYAGATLPAGAFRERLADLYREGAEWAIGVDLARLIRLDPTANPQLEQMGLLDVEHLIGERKQQDGRTDNRVELTFDQPRRRIASWLGEPAPLGALDYIGPDANLVGAFVMKDMGVIVDELFELVGANEEGFEEGLAEFEREEGIDIRRDLADPFGGEFVVALDGPLLPTPSWKLVLEVYDPARLTRTLEWLVERVNREARENGAEGLAFGRETLGEREYLRIDSLDTGFTVYCVFDDGYLLAGPSKGLLERALQNRAAGIRITDSPKFLALLPRDEEVNFSAVLYQNMAPLLGPLAGTLDALGGMPEAQLDLVRAVAAEAEPSLAVLYGHPERITLASSSEGGLFSSMLNQLSGATSLLSVQQSLAQALGEAGEAR